MRLWQGIASPMRIKKTMQYSVVNYKTAKENSDFRIDGDYFEPKYEEIIEAVKKYLPPPRLRQAGKGGFDELGNLVKIK